MGVHFTGNVMMLNLTPVNLFICVYTRLTVYTVDDLLDFYVDQKYLAVWIEYWLKVLEASWGKIYSTKYCFRESMNFFGDTLANLSEKWQASNWLQQRQVCKAIIFFKKKDILDFYLNFFHPKTLRIFAIASRQMSGSLDAIPGLKQALEKLPDNLFEVNSYLFYSSYLLRDILYAYAAELW